MDRQGSVLIVSFGPVPTAQHQTVEGGGMRCWGLALGLREHGYQVTVGINEAFPLQIDEQDGVQLVNWTLDQSFADLLNSYDTVIASYCMGDPSVFIADRLEPRVRLILDLYVPIYIEVLARDSDDLDTEYQHYVGDIARFNAVLTRGDYFMCANEPQKHFYTGILASLGVINPHTYREHRLHVVPFGVERAAVNPSRNPYADLGVSPDDFVLLWFGGLYPWFKIDSLLASVEHLAPSDRVKLVIVGGKNPFNQNPDFQRQYEFAVKYCNDHKLTGTTVHFVDWVDYSERGDWYAHADVVVSLNTPGDENALSWRTRVIDYVWGELLILTTGGDPLSDLLLSSDAAIRLEGLDEVEISSSLGAVVDAHRSGALEATRRNLVALKQRFFWDVVVEPLLPVLTSDARPYLAELERKGELAQPRVTVGAAITGVGAPTGKVGTIIRKAKTAVRIARTKGVKRSIDVGLEVVRNQMAARARRAAAPIRHAGPRYVFITHPVDNTGAPLVLLDIAEEFADKHGAKRVQLVCPSVLPNLQRRLTRAGIRTTKSVDGFGPRFLNQQLPLDHDDFVLLNTVAIYDNYRDYVFGLLEDGKLARAHWFIHEDIEQLALVGTSVLKPTVREQIKRLADADKLRILTPSDRVTADFSKLFDTTNVFTIPLHVHVDASLRTPRPAADFDRINMFLSGNPLDGRKGQFLAVSALAVFEGKRQQDPDRYRDVSLTLLSVGDDYVARQLKAIGSSLLGEHFTALPSAPREDALALARTCNVTLCCSINESFGLYVAEGMLMGHAILRNDSAGRVEQLQEGVNGYLISDDVNQFAGAIEKLADRATTNDQLQAMGAASQQIAAGFTTSSYYEEITKLG